MFIPMKYLPKGQQPGPKTKVPSKFYRHYGMVRIIAISLTSTAIKKNELFRNVYSRYFRFWSRFFGEFIGFVVLCQAGGRILEWLPTGTLWMSTKPHIQQEFFARYLTFLSHTCNFLHLQQITCQNILGKGAKFLLMSKISLFGLFYF